MAEDVLRVPRPEDNTQYEKGNMMSALTALQTLRASATEAAMWRGHNIKWDDVHDRARSTNSETSPRLTQLGKCRNCSAWVSIDTHPMPNGIDICGSAVAINCPVEDDGTQFGHKS